jgi:hypothetical protein
MKSAPAPGAKPPFFGDVKLREVPADAPPPADTQNAPEPKPFTTLYAGAGELRYEVELLTREKQPVVAAVRVTSGQRSISRTLVMVPAATATGFGRAIVTFKDDVPFDPCGDGPVYKLELEGMGVTKTIRTKNAGCTFKVTTVDPSASLPPDTRAAQRANKVYAGSPTVSFAGRCLMPFTVNATVKNATASNVAGAKLQIDGPAGAVGLGPAFTLAPGASTNATVSLPSFKVTLGSYKFSINSSAPTYESGWYAKLAIDKCTLQTE